MNKERRIVYVTGTRADYGLIRSSLRHIEGSLSLSLSIAVTGMHLLTDYGYTVSEIERDGFRVAGKVPVKLCGETSGTEMSLALGEQVIGFTKLLEEENPDVVLLLGDRGEMLAAAIAALHLNIVIVHIHGGELSGTVDESVRHAITKLSHYHFCSSTDARDRLVRMGEQADNVYIIGAPGLDDIYGLEMPVRQSVFEPYGLSTEEPVALVVFHPVVQHATEAYAQTKGLLEAVRDSGVYALILAPNADAGSQDICKAYDEFRQEENFKFAVHLARDEFLKVMAVADIMIGNSSSGIIEAACFGTPVINVGERQNMRLRNDNVTDVTTSRDEIRTAIEKALATGRVEKGNKYGDGSAGVEIASLLSSIELTSKVLDKVNAY